VYVFVFSVVRLPIVSYYKRDICTQHWLANNAAGRMPRQRPTCLCHVESVTQEAEVAGDGALLARQCVKVDGSEILPFCRLARVS
jgi:hypothetical protein